MRLQDESRTFLRRSMSLATSVGTAVAPVDDGVSLLADVGAGFGALLSCEGLVHPPKPQAAMAPAARSAGPLIASRRVTAATRRGLSRLAAVLGGGPAGHDAFTRLVLLPVSCGRDRLQREKLRDSSG